MSPIGWLATVSGALLVGGALREVFHTLLHPSGTGHMTPALFRTIWRTAHRVGPRSVQLAGPVAVVASIVVWTLMLVVGWALIYWPHLPQQFQIAQGITAGEQDDVVDAIYVSGVALATLGFGDIVAEETALRLALTTEAIIGFALLTASITWVLSIYPALMRRRALASRINILLRGNGDEARLGDGNSPEVLALILHSIAEQLATTEVDLIQYPSSYFFHGPSTRFSLPAVLPQLRTAVTRDDLPAATRSASQAVLASLDHLAQTLQEGPFPLPAAESGAILAAYAEDHRA